MKPLFCQDFPVYPPNTYSPNSSPPFFLSYTLQPYNLLNYRSKKMEPIETITYKNHTISIFPDDCTDSPRTWDNLTEFHCSHRRYSLGDEHFNYSSGSDCIPIAKEGKKPNKMR